MTTLAFYSVHGGLGATPLAFHLAHLWADLGHRVLLLDLDPQSNLTAACLPEDRLIEVWETYTHPLVEAGPAPFEPYDLTDRLHLVLGDPALYGRETIHARDLDLTLHTFIQGVASKVQADLTLVDLGPGPTALNRAALLAADGIVLPLAADPVCLRAMRSQARMLDGWRNEWRARSSPHAVPEGRLKILGYIDTTSAHLRWRPNLAVEYERAFTDWLHPSLDAPPHRLGQAPFYPGLIDMAREAHKPMFHLSPGDGAIGSFATAVPRSRQAFQMLAEEILSRLSPCP